VAYFYSVAREHGGTKKARRNRAAAAARPVKSWWGGWGFSLPTYAPNMDAAKDLIAWVTNNTNAPTLAQGQSWFVMPRKSILDVMKDGLPVYMELYSTNNALVPRPYNPKQSDAEVAVDDVGQLYLTNQMTLAEAMEAVKRIAAL
jgi:maltose-binding protein MalE